MADLRYPGSMSDSTAVAEPIMRDDALVFDVVIAGRRVAVVGSKDGGFRVQADLGVYDAAVRAVKGYIREHPGCIPDSHGKLRV